RRRAWWRMRMAVVMHILSLPLFLEDFLFLTANRRPRGHRRPSNAGRNHQWTLHPHNVPIPSEFSAYGAKGPDRLESEPGMQRVRSLIGLRNSRDDAVDILFGDGVEERPVELRADALAPCRVAAGDAHFHGRVVGFLWAKSSGCGITQNGALSIDGHQSAAAAAVRMLVKPPQPLLRRVRLDIEGDVR